MLLSACHSRIVDLEDQYKLYLRASFYVKKSPVLFGNISFFITLRDLYSVRIYEAVWRALFHRILFRSTI